MFNLIISTLMLILLTVILIWGGLIDNDFNMNKHTSGSLGFIWTILLMWTILAWARYSNKRNG